ncbi:helix-turn-helix domain-containing protein [Streptomyces subrutilus]|uniref:XRE family transcriptional regulator n=1 Tax=Streptomyces subrutilus TaxID=36818 RepID=A0A5P2UMY7_9ACTN|nr:helix-turn-helix transcriptional regulator [Streptomyces subrutilus]QEU79685.1 XRE family transcriptional regulator [Streptomyces subrutilus]WSJ31068.1 helix-turn-helix transcriptional regulator [Streptomyces subrutilus]
MPSRKDPDASANVPSFYGAELRYKRECAGLTLEQLAEGSFRGVPFLSQIERGERRMPLDLAQHVDGKLGTDGFFERRCEDARKARQSDHAEYFADVAEMEPYAETIEEWAPMLVPGLLQTPDYARAIGRAAMPRAADATIERMVAARMGRSKLFDGERPPEFWAVLDESLIRRPVLPRPQMAELLEHILLVVRRTRSILQVVPQTAAAHSLMMGMVKVMTFSDAPPVVYVESLHSGQLIDFPALVKQYRRSYDLLRAAALPPEASLALIDAAAEDYRNGDQRR